MNGTDACGVTRVRDKINLDTRLTKLTLCQSRVLKTVNSDNHVELKIFNHSGGLRAPEHVLPLRYITSLFMSIPTRSMRALAETFFQRNVQLGDIYATYIFITLNVHVYVMRRFLLHIIQIKPHQECYTLFLYNLLYPNFLAQSISRRSCSHDY